MTTNSTNITSAEDPTTIDPDSLVPATKYQAKLFENQKISPTGANAVVAMRWKLMGEIDAPAAESAIAELIDRYEIFRTSIVEIDGKIWQHIHDDAPFSLKTVDLSDMSMERALDEADAIGRKEAATPFDIQSRSLIRGVFVRLDAETVILHLTFHSATIDGWSIGVVIREFGVIASALMDGENPDLPPVSLQFPDYALWQHEMLERDGWSESAEFWRQRLANLSRFEVAPDKARPAIMSGSGEIRTLLLPTDLNAKLVGYSRSSRMTMFNIAAATLATMLRDHVGQSDVAIAVPTVMRDEVELETMVGPEVNNVVMRIDASGAQSFEELGWQCAEASADALEHAKMPFHAVAEAVGAPEDASRSPLYSVQLIQQSAYVDTGKTGNMTFGGFEIESLPSWPTIAQTDLMFFMVGREEGWRISCEANVDLFEMSSVDRMLRKWAQTIEAMIFSQGAAAINSVSYAEVDRYTPGPVPSLRAAAEAAAKAAQGRASDVAEAVEVQAALAVAPSAPSATPGATQETVDQIVALWGEVLERQDLHAGSDFFDNGGHSLSAMRMISRVNKTYELKLRTAALFKAPTLGAFAAAVDAARGIEVAAPVAAPSPVAPAPQAPAAPAAATATEETLSAVKEVWAEVLERQDLHPASDFFDNGGHSLSAMRMISRVNKAFDLKLRTAALFKAPTLGAFATAVDIERGVAIESATPAQPVVAAPLSAPVAAPAATEETIAKLKEIWAEVLERQDLQPTSDFFDNGGHSLSAMRMISRVNKAYDLKLRTAALFKSSTLGAFAAVVDAERGVAVAPAAPVAAASAPIAAGGGGAEPTPVIALNNGAAYVLLERRMTNGRRFIDVPLGDKDDAEFAANHTVQETVGRVVDRIQEAQPHGPYNIIVYCGLGPIAIEAARQLAARGEKVMSVTVLDSYAPGYVQSLSFPAKIIRKAIRLKRAVGYFFELWRDWRAGRISLAFLLDSYGFVRKLGIVPMLAKMGWIQPLEKEDESMDALNFFDAIWSSGYHEKAEMIDTTMLTFCSNQIYRGRFFPEVQGWKTVNKGDVKEFFIPCEHREMTKDPYASLIGIYMDKVLNDLDAAEANRARGA